MCVIVSNLKSFFQIIFTKFSVKGSITLFQKKPSLWIETKILIHWHRDDGCTRVTDIILSDMSWQNYALHLHTRDTIKYAVSIGVNWFYNKMYDRAYNVNDLWKVWSIPATSETPTSAKANEKFSSEINNYWIRGEMHP